MKSCLNFLANFAQLCLVDTLPIGSVGKSGYKANPAKLEEEVYKNLLLLFK